MSLVRILRSELSAPSPRMMRSPIWETSNIPARSLTARCSSRMLVYWTGISQPPNSTIRAPSATWASYKGVRFMDTIRNSHDG